LHKTTQPGLQALHCHTFALNQLPSDVKLVCSTNAVRRKLTVSSSVLLISEKT